MAKPKFDPSQPFAAATDSAKPKFDPSKPFEAAQSAAPENSWLDTQLPGGTARGYIKGALNTLPTIGMIGGGMVGGAGGTLVEPGGGSVLGAVGGAGLGGGLGTSLKNMGEQYILGEKKNAGDVIKDVALSVPESAAAEIGGQLLGKGIGAVARTKAGQAIISKAGEGAARIGELFTGVPRQEIETYAKHADDIKSLYKSADGDQQEMADTLRKKLLEDLKSTRKGLNDRISSALNGASKEKTIDVTPIVRRLEEHRNGLNPSLDADAIKDVDRLLTKLKGASEPTKNSVVGYVAPGEKVAVETGGSSQPRTELFDSTSTPDRPFSHVKSGPDGWNKNTVPTIESKPGDPKFPEWTTDSKGNWTQEYPHDSLIEIPTGGGKKYLANVQTLQQMKRFLQDQAAPAYGGTPVGFQVGKEGARAAKSAAGEANALLQAHGPAEITQANAKLARLHAIEETMNPNLLTEGRTGAPLYAAGAGNNAANAKTLRLLGSETGTDMLGEAQKVSAARTFGKPQLMPVDSTGKAAGRIGLASGLGYVIGGPAGGVIAGGLTSPAALKVAIDAGRAAGPVVGAAAKNPELMATLMKPAINLDRTSRAQEAAPSDVGPELRPTEKPLKGKDKWANDGLQKLESHGLDIGDVQAAVGNPKVKDLLVKASDLKPGSKAMDRIAAQIKNLVGEQ